MKAHGKDVKPLDKEAMLEYVQKSGGKVIAKKGATFYAVSATVCQLVGLILAASDSLATVSSMLHGEYGIEDVCLSTLTLVGPNGIQGKVQMRMNKEEVALLKRVLMPERSNRTDRTVRTRFCCLHFTRKINSQCRAQDFIFNYTSKDIPASIVESGKSGSTLRKQPK